jgi:hypothetical protein
MPDDNPYYAPMRPEPSTERLNAPSSRVILRLITPRARKLATPRLR